MSDDFNNVVSGRLIEQMIEKSGISKVDLARRINVDRKTLNNWINAKGSPSFFQMAKICWICRVDFAKLAAKVDSHKNRTGQINLDE